MDKGIVKKGILLGIVVFLVLEVILFAYSLFVMKLVPSGSEYSTIAGVLTGSLTAMQWIVHFLSRIFLMFGKPLMQNCPICANNPVIILRGIDLLFWICISMFMLHLRSKK